jgi:hypothetical protein
MRRSVNRRRGSANYARLINRNSTSVSNPATASGTEANPGIPLGEAKRRDMFRDNARRVLGL